MREQILNALIAHAKGDIEKHRANVEVLISNPMGIADHPDVIGTMEKEIRSIMDYDGLLSTLDKYFVKEDTKKYVEK